MYVCGEILTNLDAAAVCSICQKPKAQFVCGLCQKAICKKCTEFVQASDFSFLNNVPKDLSYDAYCPHCFDEKVRPAKESYEDMISRAGEVFIFYKTQSKETRTIKRKEEPVRVVNCHDKDETLLRLAFLAVSANFNSLIDVVISSQKMIIDGYQTSVYMGEGVPVHIDPNSPMLKHKDNH